MIRTALGRLLAALGVTGGSAQNGVESEPSAPAPADERLLAIDQVRATAKWLLLAFAAIGGVIVGSAPLSNVGKLGIHDWQLWVAAGAAAIAFIAIAMAMWATADVLTPVTTVLSQLVKDPQLGALCKENPELLRGHGRTLPGFYDEYVRTRNACLEAYERHVQNPDSQEDASAAAEEQRKLGEFAPVVDRISNEGLLATARDKWTRARVFMFGGALATGFSIFVFAWAANPPAKPAKAVLTRAAKLGSLRSAVHGSGVIITAQDARTLLQEVGVNGDQARSFVESFTGPIEAETLSKGAKLFRFAKDPRSTGRFLTVSRFHSSTDARLALHLPWSNTARCLQQVTARRRALVLEGGVAFGEPGVRQILALDLKALMFRRGRKYGKEPCPSH